MANNMLPIFVIIPLASAFLIPLLDKLRQGLAGLLANLCALLLLFFSLESISWLKSELIVYPVGGWAAPFGIVMVLDGLSVLMLLTVNLIGCLALVYSLSYIKKFTSPALYYTLFCLLLAGLNGMVISGDLFNLFVFLEITSIASFSLVAFGIEAEELEAAFKYLVLGSLADLMILLAIGLLLGSVSTLNMADISRALSPSSAKNLIYYCLALFIMGFGLKAALVPFHGWLADAHPAAPAPMSAMLSGVVVKVAGIYALARVIFNLIGANFHPLTLPILNWLGIVSMLIGVLLAIGQWDFKRLLAYHSISQIGYIIFGLSLGTPLGITGGLFHLFNHSLFKSLLFLNAGAVEHASGSRKLDKLGNLSQQMPLTGTTSLLASLSITGIPPLCGFWSKLMIIIAALEANNFIGAGACILVAIITLASFLKVQKYVFLRKTDEVLVGIREAPFSMCLSMAVLALLCLLAGLCFAPFLETVIRPAAAALLRGTAYAQLVLGG